ncbi:hypothetical protein GE061_003730 [Apolygus lucorum]|uniref:Uncharacterized protein n=1 Tax=Apolygus lucorum TaxID=248454 RepID=A0A6A4JCJ7_APOLU|nr:hypothetical protein GE061_003730 [Apolygus lucorum]
MESSPRRAKAPKSPYKKVVIAEVEGGKGSCPLHFGLRTYFSQIPPLGKDKEKIETVDYLEESDFHYMTNPSRKGCSWDKACMWCGLPLLIAGVVAVLIGQLVPPREPVVARRGHFAYLDRKALTFNSRLELCRLVGLGALCIAALMILLSFLLSAYSTQAQEYTPIVTAHHPGGGLPHGIPFSGVLTQVQPASVHVPPRR